MMMTMIIMMTMNATVNTIIRIQIYFLLLSITSQVPGMLTLCCQLSPGPPCDPTFD